MNLRNTNLR
jgi:hypothetical protein